MGLPSLATGDGTLSSRLKIGNLAIRRIADYVLRGPFADNYLRTLDVPMNDRTWSACRDDAHRNLQLHTELSVEQLRRGVVTVRRDAKHCTCIG